MQFEMAMIGKKLSLNIKVKKMDDEECYLLP
jgi:hypothetical protein